MQTPEVIADPNELRERIWKLRAEGRRVGLAPTMGALHAGHVSLVQEAVQECDVVVTTIFVNPTQFGPEEDFQRYPRDLQRDLDLLREAGCAVVFAPEVDVMYPAGCETRLDVGSVAKPLEGEFRPGHFPGVATVVMKLFQIAPAHAAYFGHKDYQQTLVVGRMIQDLNLPIELRVCPTIREPDGLAMSSRNAYLSDDQRERALSISRGLGVAKQLFEQGERNAERIRGAVLSQLEHAELSVDYVAVVKQGTVEPLRELTLPAVVLVAARVGATRLIDNLILS